MPSLVDFSSSTSRQRSISLDSQESTHHRRQHHSCCPVVEQDVSESSSILQDDDDDRTTRFVPETHSDEFVSATTAATTTSFRPPFPRRGKTVRFASASTNQYYTDTAGVYTNEEVERMWYTKQEVASLRHEMRQAAKQASHDTLWVNAMLKAYVGCCSKTSMADVRKMVVRSSPLSSSSSSFDVMTMAQQEQDDDPTTNDCRMGLEMAALPSLSADRQVRKTQIYQRIQQLQQQLQQCNNSSAATTTTAERISMVSRSLSRPSRLFAYYTAMRTTI